LYGDGWLLQALNSALPPAPILDPPLHKQAHRDKPKKGGGHRRCCCDGLQGFAP